ncbi:MAG: hypothetical protein Q7T18_04145 [Sedimentisphaerales bacterium]|nr:hypothetical protein [Sedimentisphaerales bacterium]
MKNKKFYIASLILLVSAIVVDGFSKSIASQSLLMRARAQISSNNEQKQLSIDTAKTATTVSRIALALAIAGVFFWWISFKCKEPAWQSVPFVLLIFFIISSFLIMV